MICLVGMSQVAQSSLCDAKLTKGGQEDLVMNCENELCQRPQKGVIESGQVTDMQVCRSEARLNRDTEVILHQRLD